MPTDQSPATPGERGAREPDYDALARELYEIAHWTALPADEHWRVRSHYDLMCNSLRRSFRAASSQGREREAWRWLEAGNHSLMCYGPGRWQVGDAAVCATPVAAIEDARTPYSTPICSGSGIFASTLDGVTPVQCPGCSRCAPPAQPSEEGVSEAVKLIAAERERQKTVEGWTEQHDDTHAAGELAQAAACYAWPPPRPLEVKQAWPWEDGWKPEFPIPENGTNASREELAEAERVTRLRTLVKAGALIVAEIERLQRAALAAAPRRES